MLLGELVSGMPVRAPAGCEGVRVCDLTEDSRTVVPGSLFIARSGLKADGKVFVEQAIRAGAVAVLTDDAGLTPPADSPVPFMHTDDALLASALLAERFYGHPSGRMSLVGVTGTNGKTTTTFLIWQLLNGASRRCGLVGTVLIDDGREVGPATMTTPPAIELSRSLSSMAEAGCVAASMEVSSHALDQKRADALRFRVGVFTNLSGDHLDYHGTMDRYARAKARLFGLLDEGGLAVVNAADAYSATMVRGVRGGVLRCGMRDDACGMDAQAEIVETSLSGMHLRLTGPWGALEPRVPLIGRYNAMNILQATASAWFMGVTPEALSAGLSTITAPPGRLERVTPTNSPFAVFVDYAHSDDSLRNVLTTVGAVIPGRSGAAGSVASAAGALSSRPTPGRLICVFGCGGDRDRSKRPRMGRAASELSDLAIVTSDNPRTERPGEIIDEILAGIAPALRERVTVQADRARAIQHAVSIARAGDVVVIAGKGHETEQILPDGKGGTVRTHFDDREVARDALGVRAPATARAPSQKAAHR